MARIKQTESKTQKRKKDATKIKKKQAKRRFKSGTHALRKIRKQQRESDKKPAGAKAVFKRLQKHTMHSVKWNQAKGNMYSPNALFGLQAGTEDFAVNLLRAANEAMLHITNGKRTTLKGRDIDIIGTITYKTLPPQPFPLRPVRIQKEVK